MTCLMTIADWERGEWSRFATAAYKVGKNRTGHKFSCAASLPKGQKLDITCYDALMRTYRKWLTFNEYPEPDGALAEPIEDRKTAEGYYQGAK